MSNEKTFHIEGRRSIAFIDRFTIDLDEYDLNPEDDNYDQRLEEILQDFVDAADESDFWGIDFIETTVDLWSEA
jgi:hypothetical protein